MVVAGSSSIASWKDAVTRVVDANAESSNKGGAWGAVMRRIRATSRATAGGSRRKTRFKKAMQRVMRKKHVVSMALLNDLQNLKEREKCEVHVLAEEKATDKEIGKRLLYLFQYDLLQGVRCAILESKAQRDFGKPSHVPRLQKIVGWTFLVLLNAAMLLYVLLFAFTQKRSRQSAWFLSFIIWLAMEMLLVSSGAVIFTHVILPSLIMKDVMAIKQRLLEDIHKFHNNLQRNFDRNTVTSQQQGQQKQHGQYDPMWAGAASCTAVGDAETGESNSFNAASYLYISQRVARHYPKLLESQVILEYSTPWPRQSYQRQRSRAGAYNRSFSSFMRPFSVFFFYLMAYYVIYVPESIQDMVVEESGNVLVGYFAFIHFTLWGIHPLMVAVPITIIAISVHFVFVASNSDIKKRLSSMNPHHWKDTVDNVRHQAVSEDIGGGTVAGAHPSQRHSAAVLVGVAADSQHLTQPQLHAARSRKQALVKWARSVNASADATTTAATVAATTAIGHETVRPFSPSNGSIKKSYNVLNCTSGDNSRDQDGPDYAHEPDAVQLGAREDMLGEGGYDGNFSGSGSESDGADRTSCKILAAPDVSRQLAEMLEDDLADPAETQVPADLDELSSCEQEEYSDDEHEYGESVDMEGDEDEVEDEGRGIAGGRGVRADGGHALHVDNRPTSRNEDENYPHDFSGGSGGGGDSDEMEGGSVSSSVRRQHYDLRSTTIIVKPSARV